MTDKKTGTLTINENFHSTLGNFSELKIKNPCLGEWELDMKKEFLYWSPNQYKVYGYEPNEIEINQDFFMIKTTHLSEIERVNEIINDALKNHNGYSFQRQIIKKGGKLGFAETRAVIVRSESGEPIKIKGVTFNVAGKNVQEMLDYSDPVFFDALYSNYKRNIFYAVLKIIYDKDTANDLCQEIFIKAWKNMSQFNPQKGAIYTWLINITNNHCKDYLRSKYYQTKKNNVPLDFCLNEKMKSGSINLEQIDAKSLLLNLPEEQGELMDLLFMQGYTQKEVAELKQMPLGTIKTKCRSAIKNLRILHK